MTDSTQHLPQRVLVSQHITDKGKFLKVAWYDSKWIATEFIRLFDHRGHMHKRTNFWWFEHVGGNLPGTIEEAVERAQDMPMPDMLYVRINARGFPEVTGRVLHIDRRREGRGRG